MGVGEKVGQNWRGAGSGLRHCRKAVPRKSWQGTLQALGLQQNTNYPLFRGGLARRRFREGIWLKSNRQPRRKVFRAGRQRVAGGEGGILPFLQTGHEQFPSFRRRRRLGVAWVSRVCHTPTKRLVAGWRVESAAPIGILWEQQTYRRRPGKGIPGQRRGQKKTRGATQEGATIRCIRETQEMWYLTRKYVEQSH